MNRRKFLSYLGCGCCSLILPSCSSAPITDRKQLKIIPEANLNAQAAQIYEKVKEKEKMSEDVKSLEEIKEIGRKMEKAIGEYFYRAKLDDPTANFDWYSSKIIPENINPNSYLPFKIPGIEIIISIILITIVGGISLSFFR